MNFLGALAYARIAISAHFARWFGEWTDGSIFAVVKGIFQFIYSSRRRSLFSFYTYCNYAIVVCKGTCKVFFLLSFLVCTIVAPLLFCLSFFASLFSNLQNPNRVYVYYLKSLRNYGRFFVHASHCVCKKVHYYLTLSLCLSLSLLSFQYT